MLIFLETKTRLRCVSCECGRPFVKGCSGLLARGEHCSRKKQRREINKKLCGKICLSKADLGEQQTERLTTTNGYGNRQGQDFSGQGRPSDPLEVCCCLEIGLSLIPVTVSGKPDLYVEKLWGWEKCSLPWG